MSVTSQPGGPPPCAQTGHVTLALSSASALHRMPPHLRALEGPSPSSQAQDNSSPGSCLRILQATPISSSLDTYCIDPKQNHTLQDLILFRLFHMICFLAVKPLWSESWTSECREAKRVPNPRMLAKGIQTLPLLEHASSDLSPSRHTGSCSSWRHLSNEEGDKEAICP